MSAPGRALRTPAPIQPRGVPPLFRHPSSSSSSWQSTSTSEASLDSSTEDDELSSDDDEVVDFETESHWSSSGISGDESVWMRRLDLSIGGRAVAAGGSERGGTGGPTRTNSPVARSNLRLSLAVLRARQSLFSHSYDSLAGALKSLSSILPPFPSLSRPSTLGATSENQLGIFVPVLARLAKDVRAAILSEDKGREFRRTKLAKEDAKALVALRQRWIVGTKDDGLTSKGKGKEVESADWAAFAEDLVAKNPPPDFLSQDPHTALDAALLTSLESFLLPSSLPRISLSNLALDDSILSSWPKRKPRLEERSTTSRASISFPFFLTTLFPNLETLSLSHNAFPHLPPWVTLFSSLRRLRTHANRLVSSRKALKPLSTSTNGRRRRTTKHAGTRANVRDVLIDLRYTIFELRPDRLLPSSTPTSASSLADLSAQLLQSLNLDGPTESGSHSALANIPSHLRDLVEASYTCISCSRFIPNESDLHVPPFWERVHHLVPGISIPSRLPPQSARPRSSSPPLSATPDILDLSDDSLAAERPATLSQRLLLTLLARLDAPTPPSHPRPLAHRRASSSTSLSSIASAIIARRPALADNGPPVLPTLVMGGSGPYGRDYRFCALCASAHLGLDAELKAVALERFKTLDPFERRQEGEKSYEEEREELHRLSSWVCMCEVCKEERRMREQSEEDDTKEAASKAKVLRWLRRKERLRDSEGAAPYQID
ncbi:Serine/arginine repetitive matrix protein 2 [Rhodotorula toruloides ATCC 204091]|nr:Serine/arginine repetitive matrix protein 2 [Rhodotorula toruloides ATCC 204091]